LPSAALSTQTNCTDAINGDTLANSRTEALMQLQLHALWPN